LSEKFYAVIDLYREHYKIMGKIKPWNCCILQKKNRIVILAQALLIFIGEGGYIFDVIL